MIEIKNRFTGNVIISVETLIEANSRWANLSGVNLSGADLYGADLREADLYGANLRGANLRGANLNRTNLCRVDLYGADLYGADLNGADLRGADLYGADLRGANLCGANLRGANLSGVNLSGADLYRTIGNMNEVKSLQVERYPVTYTSDRIQIGCKNYSIDEWKSFTDEQISKMNSNALEWWVKWKDWLFMTIEMSPAEV